MTGHEQLKKLTIEEFARWLNDFVNENEVHPDKNWILEMLQSDLPITVAQKHENSCT